MKRGMGADTLGAFWEGTGMPGTGEQTCAVIGSPDHQGGVAPCEVAGGQGNQQALR